MILLLFLWVWSAVSCFCCGFVFFAWYSYRPDLILHIYPDLTMENVQSYCEANFGCKFDELPIDQKLKVNSQFQQYEGRMKKKSMNTKPYEKVTMKKQWSYIEELKGKIQSQQQRLKHVDIPIPQSHLEFVGSLQESDVLPGLVFVLSWSNVHPSLEAPSTWPISSRMDAQSISRGLRRRKRLRSF